MTVHARVKNGRLVVDEPTHLPDGTELVLVPAGEAQERWELTPEEEAELRARQGQAEPLSSVQQKQAWDDWVSRGPDGPMEGDGESGSP